MSRVFPAAYPMNLEFACELVAIAGISLERRSRLAFWRRRFAAGALRPVRTDLGDYYEYRGKRGGELFVVQIPASGERSVHWQGGWKRPVITLGTYSFRVRSNIHALTEVFGLPLPQQALPSVR